jgi:endonuclease/exonuclease/phosphatase family metal-dependent hydrolase
MQLKIGTYNTQGGQFGTGKVDLTRGANSIKALNCDFVALQEVSPGQEKTLAAKAGFPFVSYGAGTKTGGVAVLSKHPIRSANARTIAAVAGTPYNQTRCLLITNHPMPNGYMFRFCSTHFGFEAAQMQGVWAAAFVGTRNGNSVIAGDFNCSHGSIPFQCMEIWFTPSSTGPEIDNFLYCGAITELSHEVVPDGTGDHSPTVAVIEVEDGIGVPV